VINHIHLQMNVHEPLVQPAGTETAGFIIYDKSYSSIIEHNMTFITVVLIFRCVVPTFRQLKRCVCIYGNWIQCRTSAGCEAEWQKPLVLTQKRILQHEWRRWKRCQQIPFHYCSLAQNCFTARLWASLRLVGEKSYRQVGDEKVKNLSQIC